MPVGGTIVHVVCISDLHNHTIPLPPGDLLLVAGDITMSGTRKQVRDMLQYLSEHRHLYTNGIVLIAGNHDFLFQNDPLVAEQMCKDMGITYLCESGCEIAGFKIWGSPYVPRIGDWAFGYDPYMEPRIWKRIPEDTDILMTHGAPMGVLDSVTDCWHIGSDGLLSEILTRQHVIKLHVFGHVHEGYGIATFPGTRFVNACICDEEYEPNRVPWEVEI